MKKLVVFNWKMNPPSLREAERVVKSIPKKLKAELVICPPFIYLGSLSHLVSKSLVKLGAQDVFWKENGAYTGEISAKMLKNLKIEYVIVGHSERRNYLEETDEMINKKVSSALKAGLKVILCVGENLTTRRRGKKAVMAFVKKQLEKDLKGIFNLKALISNLIIAYEPIWAIGTDVPCEPKDALEVIKFIKKTISFMLYASGFRVLYGGSVNGKNIQSFIQYKDIDGALVGGASLKPEQFNGII